MCKKSDVYCRKRILTLVYHLQVTQGNKFLTTLLHFLNFNPMVQVETAQLISECEAWRQTLREYRDEFTQDKTKLQQAASRTLTKDQLQDVEHLHNQFHIQLINIHDLKQAIKNHDRNIGYEMREQQALNEETLADHESLFNQYQSLEHTLQDIREEFSSFLARAGN